MKWLAGTVGRLPDPPTEYFICEWCGCEAAHLAPPRRLVGIVYCSGECEAHGEVVRNYPPTAYVEARQ